jgi:hypothetical protein
MILLAGALTLGLPAICNGGGGGGCSGDGGGCSGWGSVGGGNGNIHVPILNNTGETLTIRRMYIDTPGDDELRVRAILFVGEVNNSYTAGSKGYRQNRGGSGCGGGCGGKTSELNKIISFASDNYYRFSPPDVVCRITFDYNNPPSGTYTIRYYFKYDDDTEDTADRENTVTFNL